jgi:serine/threonine protein kinase
MSAVFSMPVRVPETGNSESWRLREGTEISPGRQALTLLGGGDRYEAYVAWDDTLHTTVVAKILRPHLLDDVRARSAIEAEAEALRVLQHPVLVRSFDAALDGPVPHLALEHLDGPRLSTLIRKFGPLAAEQLVPLARQLASAIAYLANQGWVHLDIKPRNTIMTASPRLIDLSVARPIEAARRLRTPTGTDPYMAPEQCDPTLFERIGPPSDVWGLGATLYEALTGEQAFAATGGDRFPQLRQGPPRMPRKAPPVLAGVITAAMAPDPADRPRASEFDGLLEPLADWSARGVRRIR